MEQYLPETLMYTRRDMPLAAAYVPFQNWKTTYEPQIGLERGTIFPELDLPFAGRGGIKRYE
ncbi:MAG: spore coat associated protein CotJA [Oscillospiraceae bacterium]|nr:spore coat associated protein CotJA [Oscillospiraceae bacterium]